MGSAWWRFINMALLGVFFFHGYSSAKKPPNYSFMHEATKAPRTSFYDYIIVGGGTAACPLGATLSQRHKVLVLERGGSPYGNPNITSLSNFGSYFSDSSPESPSQQFVSEDGIVNGRARVLGGGSAINAGFYSRAEAEFVRQVGWDEGLVEESFEWVEKAVVFRPVLGQWQRAVKAALLEAGVVPDNGFTYDHLIGTKIGGTIFDKNGRRHTAANLLQYANPRGITVLLHATVHKILFKVNGKSNPVAYGVIYKDVSGALHTAYLSPGPQNEIILSAGAMGSPQILMLSGVGPKAQLEALNISAVLNQPLVGQGMADNPQNVLFIPSPTQVEQSLVQIVGITSFGSYIESSSGLNFPGVTGNQYGGYNPTMGGFIVEKVNGPLSKGFLRLRNVDPSDNPAVRFNYFQNPEDLDKCVNGMKTILRAVEAKAFSKFRYDSLSPQDLLNLTANLPQSLPVHPNTTTDLGQFCRDTVRTIWHYHGGCQVGSVVDRDYKVLGIDALRVIDGSTFLNSPGTNPQATVMMLGRYMGVKMLRGRQ